MAHRAHRYLLRIPGDPFGVRVCVRLEEELSAHMRQRVEEHRRRLAASPTAVSPDEEPADYIDAFLAEQQRRHAVGAEEDEAEDFTGKLKVQPALISSAAKRIL